MKFPRLKKSSHGGDGGSSTMSGAIRVGGKIKSRIARSSFTKQQHQQQPSSPNTTTQKQAPIPIDLPKMEDLLAGNTAVASASVVCGGGATGIGGGDENGGVSMANGIASTQVDTTKKQPAASASTLSPSQLPPSPSPPPPPSLPVFDFNESHLIDDNGANSPPPPPLRARSPLSPRGFPTSPRGSLNRALSPQSSAGTSAGYTHDNATVLSIHSHQVELSAAPPAHKRGDSSAGGGVHVNAAPLASPVVDSPAETDAVPITEELNVQATATTAVQHPAATPGATSEAEGGAVIDEGREHSAGASPYESAPKIYLPRSPRQREMAKEAIAEVQGGERVCPTSANATTTAAINVDKAVPSKDEALSRYAVLKVDTGAATDATIDDDAQGAVVEAAISPSQSASEHSNTIEHSQNNFSRARSTGTINTVLSMRSEVLVEDFETLESTLEDGTEAEGEREDGNHDIEDSDDTSMPDDAGSRKKRAAKKIRGRSRGRRDRRYKVNEKRLRDGHRRACKLLKNGDFDKALVEFESILGLLMSSFGESHRRVGTALHNVAIVNIRANHLDDAIDAIEEAVRIRKEVHGPDHPKVADSLVELGIALLSQKEFEDSLEIFNEALELREIDLAEEARHGTDEERIHCVLQVSKVLSNIGCVYFEFGSLDKAQKTYEDVLEMQKEAVEEIVERDPEYKQTKLSLASTMCNLGYVHMDNSDWDDAIDFFDEAYSVSQLYEKSSLPTM
mmetsp:Transcript_27268/g.54971  ORF Transcript_27268/g.54971 Transcript_27268/m.54971 type:complete len:736 (-) Transcript_27268:1-2208(-)